MLIESITPLMIATAPITIDLPRSTYDHKTQVSSSVKVAAQRTQGGTRSYDYKGNPNDNDND